MLSFPKYSWVFISAGWSELIVELKFIDRRLSNFGRRFVRGDIINACVSIFRNFSVKFACKVADEGVTPFLTTHSDYWVWWTGSYSRLCLI